MKPIKLWEVPCLGGKFTEKQLEPMDAGVWEYIAIEMKDNQEFLDAFQHMIVVKFDPTKSSNSNLNPDKPVNVVNVDAPIKSLISHEDEKQYPEKLPEGGNLVSFVTKEKNVFPFQSSRYYKYDKIIPNDVPCLSTKFTYREIEQFKTLGIQLENITYDSIENILEHYKSKYFPLLQKNNYYVINERYVPETELHNHIVFLVCSKTLQDHVLLAYLPELFRFKSVVSRSKYLTTDVILEIGWMLDWKYVSEELYTKSIVEQYIDRINKKYALYMEIETPAVNVYHTHIDKLIIEYLEKKNELLEQMIQREFILQKTNVGLSNVQTFEDEYNSMMFDDDYNPLEEGENDIVDVITRRKKNMGLN